MAVKWAMRGAAGAKAIEQDDKEAEIRREQNSHMWRFYLKYDTKANKGDEARVTFIDGNLNEDGLLDILYYRQHNVAMNGKQYNNFVCTADVEPCPICATGNKPDLVGVMTVIDHRETKNRDGTKTYKDQPRLFVAKKGTIKVLQTLAGKRGGLAGCTVDISRTGELEASVGNLFDVIEKNDPKSFKGKYTEKNSDGKEIDLFVPADYEKELDYKTADQLRELGFGGGMATNHDKGSYGDAPPQPNYEGKM